MWTIKSRVRQSICCGDFLRTQPALKHLKCRQVFVTLPQNFALMVFDDNFLKNIFIKAVHDCQTSLMTFNLLFPGLVESGNKWQARFCSSCICQKDWLPQSLPGASLTGSWSGLSCTKATGSGWQVSLCFIKPRFMIFLSFYHNLRNQPPCYTAIR